MMSDLSISRRIVSDLIQTLLFELSFGNSLRVVKIEVVWNRKVSNDFKIHWNISLKILYLEDYKWLLSQKQQVRIYFRRH